MNPPIISRIRSLFSALWMAAKLFCSGGPVIVPPEQQKRRVAICQTCPYRSEGIVDACSICGCSIQAKAILLYPGCPVGKWNDADRALSRFPTRSFFLRTPRVSFL